MFVLGLIVVNVALIALRLFDSGDDEAGAEAADVQQNAPLPAIELLEDTPPDEAVAEPESGGDSLVEAAGVPEGHACVRIGPFDSANAKAGVQLELQKLFSRVHSRETKLIIDDGYWVLLPPFPTQTEAELAVDKLKTAGIGDYYRVREGNSLNAVSLGIYDRREPAEARRRQVRDLLPGLVIVVELQTKIKSQYWLEAGPVDALNPALIQLSTSHPGAEQRQIACPVDLMDEDQ